jgi:hypothetical protein
MAPSRSGLAADRFARLSANAANKESDNCNHLVQRAPPCRSDAAVFARNIFNQDWLPEQRLQTLE